MAKAHKDQETETIESQKWGLNINTKNQR